MSESLEDRETELNKFANAIENHLKKYRSYSFRTVSIDGVLCYPVIHKYRKIVNFECVNIECKITNSQGYSVKEKYSVYHKSYKTIRNAILIVENVIATFRIVDGDLISADEFKICILERKFNPYQEDQICSICYENTMDITECEHYLCLKCRESCIRKKKLDCPICRKKEAVVNYNIDNGLINNVVYKCIKDINEYERTGKENIKIHDDEEEDVAVTLSELLPREFTVSAFIDRIGDAIDNRIHYNVRSQSSEDLNYLPHGTILDDDLSEVPTLDSNAADDSEDIPIIDLYELFRDADEGYLD
jgi:hypothetical protein